MISHRRAPARARGARRGAGEQRASPKPAAEREGHRRRGAAEQVGERR